MEVITRTISIKAPSLQILTMITLGRQNIISASSRKVTALGHNDTAPVVDRRKMRVCLIASALNFSSFHYSPLLLIIFLK